MDWLYFFAPIYLILGVFNALDGWVRGKHKGLTGLDAALSWAFYILAWPTQALYLARQLLRGK